MGFVIEGDWFDADHFSTHRIIVETISDLVSVQNAYPENTTGSMLHASKNPAAQFENSFVGYYYSKWDLPSLYRNGSQFELTEPFPRAFGNTMQFDGDEPLVWTTDVPTSYGSTQYGADHELTGDIASELQSWIDSEHYDPSTGKYWLGLLFDKQSGVNIQYRFYGPAGAQTAPKITIHWHPRRINVV